MQWRRHRASLDSDHGRRASPVPTRGFEDDDSDDDAISRNETRHLLPSRLSSSSTRTTTTNQQQLLPQPQGPRAFKVASVMFSFCVLGLVTSTIGAILPHLEAHYYLSDAQVSFVFIAWPIGYVLAASLNDVIHIRLGQRGIAIIGSLAHIVAAAGCAAHPSFHWFLLFVAATFFGAGILDGSMCAWAGALERASTVTGFLHGSYSVGAALSPLLIDALVSESASRPWYTWYYVLLGVSILELILLLIAFRHDDGAVYTEQKWQSSLDQDESPQSHGFGVAVLAVPAIWLCSAYLLSYVGTETSISGWVITFMQRVRHATPFVASLCSSGFWTGMAVGRLALGALTDRLGIRLAVTGYTVLTIVFAILFGVSRNDAMSVSAISLLGIFCGPLFPSAIVLLTAALPSELHVPGVSFVASVGQVGGTLIPFGLGLIINAVGMSAFQAVFLGQLVLSLFLWTLYYKIVM